MGGPGCSTARDWDNMTVHDTTIGVADHYRAGSGRHGPNGTRGDRRALEAIGGTLVLFQNLD